MVQNKVEYICHHLRQLNVIEHFPDADVPSEQVVNRATDVLSSALTYLAVHIRYEGGQFGLVGRLPSVPGLTDFHRQYRCENHQRRR